VLEDFGRFWKEETDPEARRGLLQPLFELVWPTARRSSPSDRPLRLQTFSPAPLRIRSGV
jgi:hypothetical protein